MMTFETVAWGFAGLNLLGEFVAPSDHAKTRFCVSFWSTLILIQTGFFK